MIPRFIGGHSIAALCRAGREVAEPVNHGFPGRSRAIGQQRARFARFSQIVDGDVCQSALPPVVPDPGEQLQPRV